MLNSFNYSEEPKEPKEKKKINKKKIFKISAIVFVALLITISTILYLNNSKVRNFFDKYVFRKEVYENNLDMIPLNEEDNNYAYVYGKNIVVLNNNNLSIYNSTGKKEDEMNIEITTPIFCTKEKYLCIAENNGSKVYLISGNNIIWQKNIDGMIKGVSINKNGYVSVVSMDTGYKSIVSGFSNTGEKLITMGLAMNYAIDTEISEDNKYLAVAEMNFIGTVIQSYVKIVSLDEETIDYNYVAPEGKMIIKIAYQEKGKLVCMYEDSIHIIQNNSDVEFCKIDQKSILFSDINLNNSVAQIEKKDVLDSDLKFKNTQNNSVKTYEIEGIPKSVSSYKDVTAVNLGTEAIFVKNNGWLLKRYKSGQEIQDIILSNNVAGIIYKNKIEIIKL